MDAVFRAATIYFFLLVVFRIAGSRSLSQMTTFDFVLLLIIAEATQQGLSVTITRSPKPCCSLSPLLASI
jgi:uncharacterized membrane protein YcaP (DUF421 family)